MAGDDGRSLLTRTAGAGPVLLLHGMGRTGAAMGRIAAALEARGHVTWSPTWNWRRPLSELVPPLAERLRRWREAVPGPLDIVTHSMGGLVARALIHAQRPEPLRRVVMLAPPNRGSGLADALVRWKLGPVLGAAAPQLVTWRRPEDEALLGGAVDYELGIIAGDRPLIRVPEALLPSPNDGKVAVDSTPLAGMRDHLLLPLSHWMLSFHPMAVDAVLRFVETGSFHPAPAAGAGRTPPG